nr:copia protein [Tanacetum cinerariifolium]
MNKLVKGNLVRGLPSKIFENNHTCVACKKGKQHRATYPLRKFDKKADKGFLVGYSVNSKAFRLFNSRTQIIQETLHINLLENQPNVAGSRPKWLFDIDTLTQSINYQPVVTGNQPNHNAGIKENLNASKVRTKIVSAQQYVLLPLWSTGLQHPKNTDDDDAFNIKENENEVHVSLSSSDKPKNHDDKAKRADKGKSPVDLSLGVKDLRAEFEEFLVNNTNRANDVSAPVTAIGPNLTNNTNSFNTASPSATAVSPNFKIAGKCSFIDPSNYPNDPDMPTLEDIVYSDDEEDVGAEADLSNLETDISVNKEYGKDGKRTRNKARLVAQGHTQEEGIDYDEVFAPVARIEAIWLFLAYASFMGFMVYLMDVKSTILYETIEKEVYVYQPPGFKDPDYPDKVYKVVKALYGLHQAPRAWYKTLDNYLLENDFQRVKIDQTLFIKKQKGLQVKQKDDGIFISQNKYVAEILSKFGFIDVKSASTLNETEKPLLKDHDELAHMGFEKLPPKLTFYKAFFSVQWKFLIHTLVQCVSAKRTAWNEFSCLMASVIIYLATVQPQTQAAKEEDDVKVPASPTSPSSTNAPSPPPQDPIPTPPQAQPGTPLVSPPQEKPITTFESDMTLLNTLMETCATLSQKVVELEQEKQTQALEILKLKIRVKKLEKKRKSKSSGLKRLRKGRIDDVSVAATKDVNAVEPTVFNDEEVTITMAWTLIKMKAEKARLLDEQMAKRLHDEEVEKATAKEKQEKYYLEKAKGLQQQYDDKQENIDWNAVAKKIQEKHLDNIRKYQSLKMKPVSIAQARKNMIIYLKNMAGYKMEHFRCMTYKKVIPIFEREYNNVQTLFKPDKDVEKPTKKRVAEETLLQESFKKLKAVEVLGSESTSKGNV